MSSADIKFDMDKLNDSNYSVWEFKVRAIIQREGLLSIINEEPPAEKSDEWSKNDGKVKSIILFSITDSQLVFCRKAKTAYDIWMMLKEHHEKSTLFSKVILLKKICKTAYNGSDSMVDHLNKLRSFFDKLTLIGQNLNDSMIIAFILSSMPESYDSVVMSLETRPEDQLTVKIVEDCLIQEYERRKNKDNSSSEKVYKVNSTKNCFFCNKTGHKKANCYLYLKSISNCRSSDKNPPKFNSNKKSSNAAKVASSNEILFSLVKSDSDTWYIDSAATSHMCSDKNFFRKY